MWLLCLEEPLGVFGGLLFIMLIVVAVGAPLWAGDPTSTAISRRLLAPSGHAWFGTDQFGRDVWSRFAYGAQTSLLVGIASVVLASSIGGLLGVFSGLVGGKVDTLIQRIVDALLCMPSILLAILVMSVLGSSTANTILAIAFTYFPRICRITRAVAIGLRESPFVESAAIAGASTARITLFHVAPNCVAPWIVFTSAQLATALLAEATLSFLGLGVPAPTPSWGRDISEAINRMEDAPWLVIFPGLGLCLAVFAANFVGDSLRNYLDPRLKRI